MNNSRSNQRLDQLGRRGFVKQSAAIASAVWATHPYSANAATEDTVISFGQTDSLVHPPGWESLNPGFWKCEDGMLVRRISNVGDRARRTGFPFHYESKGGVMQTDYDPSLPSGVVYRRDYFLRGKYSIFAEFEYRGVNKEPDENDDPKWKMFQAGYGLMGLAIGAKNLFESYHNVLNATQLAYSDDGKLTIIHPAKWKKGSGNKHTAESVEAFTLKSGDKGSIQVDVEPRGKAALVSLTLKTAEQESVWSSELPLASTEGFVGIVGRGLAEFGIGSLSIQAAEDLSREVSTSPCLACYPLGDRLQQNEDEKWTTRFIGIFDQDGQMAEIRVSDRELEDGEWLSVPVAGSAKIVNNDFRRNTAVIEVVLPHDPGETEMFYTVWKDGVNVTSDPRVGTDAVGPGTGLVGDVPSSGSYIGRLPKLAAPYKMCGLSCHAITSGLQEKTNDGYRMSGGRGEWQFRDQPTKGAYQHLDDYDFQIMVWEDDVWYMELVLYPPSTDDAYKIITQSICGPTSRWQLMRHWNVINPGDHDYGMDDVKGPEQIAIRNVDGLGQDASYMRRNFQIVHHLITGDEEVDPRINPKKWRAWKMPRRDFTFVILDSRLWRSSQNVDIWTDQGWGQFKSLYDRTDPTRSLLGEEQFGWLQELLATDSSRLICLTGINGLHTIWTGGGGDFESGKHPMKFSQRDRVTADYAGWVKAGADRVLELLGSRDGVVTVYGDVHNGSIVTNAHHRVIECSFGPIGRSGGRAVIPGFGPEMQDVDGRQLTVHSLYHKQYAAPDLSSHAKGEPFYWNFLEMSFDPSREDPAIELQIRNLVDAPDATARGGGALKTTASQTGRLPTSTLPSVKTITEAEIQIMDLDGKPIRGTRSLPDGRLAFSGFADVGVGTEVLVIAHRDDQSEVQKLRTVPVK